MQLGTRAVPPRRVGANVGSRVGGRDGGGVAADRMRARQHASSISYAIRRCCDAQVSATAAMAPLPIPSRHICPPIYAQPNAHAFACTHREPLNPSERTHGCTAVYRGDGRRGPWSIRRDADPRAAVTSSAARPSGCNTCACGRAASARVSDAEAIPATATTRIRTRCCARSRRSCGRFVANGHSETRPL